MNEKMEPFVWVPREQYEHARCIANLAGMGPEVAEAEAARLREAIREHHKQTESIAEAVGLGHHSPADEELWAALDAKDGDE